MRCNILLLFFCFMTFSSKGVNVKYYKQKYDGFSLWCKVEKSEQKKDKNIKQVNIVIRLILDYENNSRYAEKIDSILTVNSIYMAFKNEQNILLVKNEMDTLKPKMYLYDGDLGMHREYKMMVVFEWKEEIKSAKLNLVIDEKLFYRNYLTQELF